MNREGRLLLVSRRQYSVFTTRQAMASGYSASAIKRMVDSGRWVRLHRSVMLPAVVALGWQQKVMAACLACGSNVVASFSSAAIVWGLTSSLDIPHVTVTKSDNRRHRGITIHTSEWLDRRMKDGFPVTNPMRTVLDLAACYTEARIEQAYDAAHRLGLVNTERMKGFLALDRNRNAPGSPFLREVVDLRCGSRPMGSNDETDLFRLLRRCGLPLPTPQLEVMTPHGARYLDFCYPEEKLVIEVDGLQHGTVREVFDDDHIRQNDLEDLGYRFKRFTTTQIRQDPREVAFTIGRALRLHPIRWSS